MRTFWKSTPIALGKPTDKLVLELKDPNDREELVAANLRPLGSVQEVCQSLLTIPQTFACFELVDQQKITLLWAIDQGVMLSFKEEMEFGPGGVFSIGAVSRVSEKVFFKLYVQIHERFDAILLDDSGFFVEVKAFRQKIK